MWVCCASLLFFFYSSVRPISYTADATFKKGKVAKSDVGNSLQTMLFNNFSINARDDRHISLMKSRVILKRVVQDLSLQASVHEVSVFDILPLRILSNIMRQLYVEYRSWRSELFPPLKDPRRFLDVSYVRYSGEIPRFYKLYFTSNDTFDVFDDTGEKVTSGKLGIPVVLPYAECTFVSGDRHRLKRRSFIVSLKPVLLACNSVRGMLDIKEEKADPGIIVIECRHRDRRFAATLLNSFMDIYHTYLIEKSEEIAREQLHYLAERKDETIASLDDVLFQYKQMHLDNIQLTDFMRVEDQAKFFLEYLKGYKSQLFEIDMKLKSLDNYSIALLETNETVLGGMYNELRSLLLYKDSLGLGSKSMNEVDDNMIDTIQHHMQHLKEKQDELRKIEELMERVEHADSFVQISSSLEQMPQIAQVIINTGYSDLEREMVQEELISYLKDTARTLSLQINVLKALAYSGREFASDFQGLSVESARDLYSYYNKELIEIQSDISQFEYLFDALEQPQLELGAFCLTLDGEMGKFFLNEVTSLGMKMQSPREYSGKEAERFSKSMEEKKRFLSLHMQQNIDLYKLREQVIRQKLSSLEQLTLSLITKHVSTLEEQLDEYVQMCQVGLLTQREYILAQLDELRVKMETMSDFWFVDKKLKFHLELGMYMVQEIANLVESHNIAHNLESIDSKVLDSAELPVFPNKPMILPYMIIGGILGMFFSLFYYGIKGYVRGFPISEANLAVAGLPFAGYVDEKSRISSIGKLVTKLSSLSGNIVTCFLGESPSYLDSLLTILNARGYRFLVIDTSRYIQSDEESEEGLYSYLAGAVHECRFFSHGMGDVIPSGKNLPGQHEYLASKKFGKFLEEKSREYDMVIITSSGSFFTPVASHLVQLSNAAVFSVKDETIEDFSEIRELSDALFFLLSNSPKRRM